MIDRRHTETNNHGVGPPERRAIRTGDEFDTVFESNPKSDSPFAFRSTRADGARAPKVVLSKDTRIRPGQPCRVRATRVRKPDSPSRGHIEVELIGTSLDLGPDVWIEPHTLRTVQAVLESGLHILLDGPQGCGKTMIAERIAAGMRTNYVFFNCAAVYEPTDFVATLRLRATASGGVETVWTPTDILQGLESARSRPVSQWMIFLDEFNRCRESARNALMPALDRTRRIYNPISGSFIQIPDNVRFVAAINSGAQFSGASHVDPAQYDRFFPVRLNYPPEQEELRLMRRRFPSVHPRLIQLVVRAAGAVRRDQELRVDLSVRAVEDVCMILSHGHFVNANAQAFRELVRDSFSGRFDGSPSDPDSEAGRVWAVAKRALDRPHQVSFMRPSGADTV